MLFRSHRREDIPVLAKYFTNRIAKHLGVRPIRLSDEIFAAMQGYDWPGNVRQMHNVIETLLIMAPDDRNQPVGLDLLPAEIQNISRQGANSDMEQLMTMPLRGAREEFEREYLETQWHRFNGNISRMAAFIGMERSALHRKIKSLDIATDLQGEVEKT